LQHGEKILQTICSNKNDKNNNERACSLSGGVQGKTILKNDHGTKNYKNNINEMVQ